MVKAGRRDSVASIANRYKLSAANVADWNDVKTNHVFARGFSVVVYLPVRAAASARVGTGTPRGVGAKAPVRKGLVSKKPVAARQPIVQQKRGGTPAKSKR